MGRARNDVRALAASEAMSETTPGVTTGDRIRFAYVGESVRMASHSPSFDS